jgi:PKD repeat protein
VGEWTIEVRGYNVPQGPQAYALVYGPQPNTPPIAAFSASCSNLSCTFDASASSDTDGQIRSYIWSFGDGTLGRAASVSHIYAAAGTYSVGLAVVDNGGASSTTSKQVIAQAPPAGYHVGDLDGSRATSKTTWSATVTITAHDNAHNKLSNITVSGAWSGYNGTVSCKTGSKGTCSLTKSGIPSGTASVTFSVSNMTDGSAKTYNSSMNHDPESDSNGTSITIKK